MAENVVFQQRINGKGNVEFRTKFGRSKAIVMRRHDGYFYIDMYDNRPGKSDRISIGTDELELLCNMKGSLESLKSHFPAQVSVYFDYCSRSNSADRFYCETNVFFSLFFFSLLLFFFFFFKLCVNLFFF